MFMQMANNRDVLNQSPNLHQGQIIHIDNTFLTGFAKMKKTIRTKDHQLNKFKKHTLLHGHLTREEDDAAGSDEDDASSLDM
jgi:hypothetical protein